MSAASNPSLDEKKLKLELRLAQIEKNEKCRDDFLTFVKSVWPDFIAGRHHRIIAEKLERVARGELKRLIINMAPRHTKSEFASYLFPAWFMDECWFCPRTIETPTSKFLGVSVCPEATR